MRHPEVVHDVWEQRTEDDHLRPERERSGPQGEETDRTLTAQLDGRLRGAPEMTDCPSFHRRELGLFPVRHELWEGFIFVNLDGRVEPLAPRLEPLRKQLAEFRLAEWVTVASRDYGEMPWDWKVAQDNGDCYHHIGLHRKSVEWLWPMKTIPISERTCIWCSSTRTTGSLPHRIRR